VRRNAFGRQVDSFEGDVDVAALETPFHAMFIRAPWVEEVGPEVEVLARVAPGEAAGEAAGRIVAVRQGHLVATSFHPEVTGDPRIHELFLDVVRETAAARDSRTTTSTTD
jgi:5'-phosphate synthase pdxT subunit